MKILTAAERLALLCRKDGNSAWSSLEDQRVCLICHRLFTGHDVQMSESSDGQQKVHCPTANCASTPVHWFYYASMQGPVGRSSGEPPRQAEIGLDFAD